MGQKKDSDSKSFRPTESYSWSIGKMSRKGNVLALTNTFFSPPHGLVKVLPLSKHASRWKKLEQTLRFGG